MVELHRSVFFDQGSRWEKLVSAVTSSSSTSSSYGGGKKLAGVDHKAAAAVVGVGWSSTARD